MHYPQEERTISRFALLLAKPLHTSPLPKQALFCIDGIEHSRRAWKLGHAVYAERCNLVGM